MFEIEKMEEEFDYSLVDEVTAKRLKEYEKEINEQFKRLGYAAYNLGIIKSGKNACFIERVSIASKELELDREFVIRAIATYLDGEE